VSLLPPLAKPLLVRHLVEMLPCDAGTEPRDFLRVLCVVIDCPPPQLPERQLPEPLLPETRSPAAPMDAVPSGAMALTSQITSQLTSQATQRG
jgi:hypothetical protein